MERHQRTARIIGALYLLTVVTSIPALILKAPVLADPGSITPGAAAALTWAALLELVLAAACVGTAVAFFPLARRQSEALALGFVSARIVEAALVAVGVIAMLSLARTAAQPAAGALVAVHDWAFLIGPGLIPAINALCLGTVLYRSRLVPRILPVIGLVGAPLLIVSAVATVFGAADQVSAMAGLAALPIAAWEIGLGVWLVTKGFDADAASRLGADPHVAAALPA